MLGELCPRNDPFKKVNAMLAKLATIQRHALIKKTRRYFIKFNKEKYLFFI